MDERLRLAKEFVDRTACAGWAMKPLAGDASARRYFRLCGTGNTAVLMDASPESGQSVRRFMDIVRLLESMNLSVPTVLAADPVAGFAILEDFGESLFARLVTRCPDMEVQLYDAATDVLAKLDGTPVPEFVPDFQAELMAAQVEPVYQWYRGSIQAVSGTAFNRLRTELETVLLATATGPPTLLLRDFHSENLVWLPDRKGVRRVGLLDFQDAMSGPPGYDLVSMLLDARRDVSPAVASSAEHRFARMTGRDPVALGAALAAIGAQRNLRIMGVFARLAVEAGKPRYLDLIPRVWQHVTTCLSHSALSGVARVVAEDLPEPSPDNMLKLKERCLQNRH